MKSDFVPNCSWSAFPGPLIGGRGDCCIKPTVFVTCGKGCIWKRWIRLVVQSDFRGEAVPRGTCRLDRRSTRCIGVVNVLTSHFCATVRASYLRVLYDSATQPASRDSAGPPNARQTTTRRLVCGGNRLLLVRLRLLLILDACSCRFGRGALRGSSVFSQLLRGKLYAAD
jgi:hypothetical protein